MAFVNSAHTLVKSFGFDGLDLAWEFPETKPKKIRSSLGMLSFCDLVGELNIVCFRIILAWTEKENRRR